MVKLQKCKCGEKYTYRISIPVDIIKRMGLEGKQGTELFCSYDSRSDTIFIERMKK